jgi:arabinofuranosyltransferase
VKLLAAALALPVAYEIFRAGFYGTLVPLPALAKGATGAEWGRGWDYLVDFVRPFWLWIPFAVFAVVLAIAVVRRSITPRDRILLAAPLVSALLLALYVLRVGGDFMHARMWLPATFAALLPGLLVPLRRITVPAIALVGAWAAIMHWRATHEPRVHRTGWLIEDERVGYTWWTKDHHPVSGAPFVKALEPIAQLVRDARRDHRRALISEGGGIYPLGAHVPASIVFVAGRLGTGGAIGSLDEIVADTLGLANPLGARITVTTPDESPGHQKSLPWPWLLADFADPDRYEETGFPPATIRAARHAMSCGALAEMLAAAREPMTVSRFLANLAGSIGRTRLVIPADPIAAEIELCGSSSIPRVTASSSCEQWGWSARHVADGALRSWPSRLGFSSAVWSKENHIEWIAVELPRARSISSVVLHPRTDGGHAGSGFPIDFSIQVWNGTAWVDRVVKAGFPRPDAPQTFSLGEPVVTNRLRVHATRLQNVPEDGYVLQLAEIEVP